MKQIAEPKVGLTGTGLLKSLRTGMVFIDRTAKRKGLGRRFVTPLTTATKTTATVKCLSWYEFEGTPKISDITAKRLMSERDYYLVLEG